MDHRHLMNPGEKLVTDLIAHEEKYGLKRVFQSQKLQYCIQNPKRQDELITVHSCYLGAGYADPELSMDQMHDDDQIPEDLLVPYETVSSDEK